MGRRRPRTAPTCSARGSGRPPSWPGGTRSPSSPRWSSRTPPCASPVARGGPPPPPPAAAPDPAPGTPPDPPNSFSVWFMITFVWMPPSHRKRRPRRQFPAKIPPVVLALDDEDDKTDTAEGLCCSQDWIDFLGKICATSIIFLSVFSLCRWFGNPLDGKSEVKATKEEEKVVLVGDKEASGSGEKAAATGNMPCMDRLREELSCAVRVLLFFSTMIYDEVTSVISY